VVAAAVAGPVNVIVEDEPLKVQSNYEGCVAVVERKAAAVGRNLGQKADTNLGEGH